MRGQIALEYLLVLTIILAAFSFIVSKAIPQYNKAIERMEIVYAERVLKEMENYARGLMPLAEGSFFKIEVKPKRKWLISSGNFGIEAEIENERVKINAENIFCESFLSINEKGKIRLEKRDGCVIISQE